MPRSQRLLDLIQTLRRHRRPVSGAKLAEELGVSLRTIYRDIQTLIEQGANIAGEAGIGYVLKPGFLLPPLMFSDEEIEALVLGSRWVAQRADRPLAEAAQNALAKIAAVLPEDMRDDVDASGLLAGPGETIVPDGIDLVPLRLAIRQELKIGIGYCDASGQVTERVVWPIALGFFDRVRVVAAWCELRAGYRHFRTDRIRSLVELGQRYPRPRRVLMQEWRAINRIPEQ